jgi:hypothetical protein
MDEWVSGNVPSLSLVSLGAFHNSKYHASNECLGEYKQQFNWRNKILMKSESSLSVVTDFLAIL